MNLQGQARAIYAPIQDQLAVVINNLRQLATSSGTFTDRSMVEHAVVSGGKMVRPAITLLAGGTRVGNDQALTTMATAVELLHIATLIHDDTVDRSNMRRGRATISSLWGDEVAVLLGDYVFAASATFVCDTNNLKVVKRFSETIMELANGELEERFSTHNWHQTLDDYNQRTYNKTASLFCTSAVSGGVLSGGDSAECDALHSYGYNLGMAFQIVDDVLDFLGTEQELGKPAGNDLMQGTITLPALLYAAENREDPVIKRLQAGSRQPSDLLEAVEAIRKSDAISATLATIDNYRKQAKEALTGIPNTPARDSLELLIDQLAERRS